MPCVTRGSGLSVCPHATCHTWFRALSVCPHVPMPCVTRGSGLSLCVPMSPCRVSHVVQGSLCVPMSPCHVSHVVQGSLCVPVSPCHVSHVVQGSLSVSPCPHATCHTWFRALCVSPCPHAVCHTWFRALCVCPCVPMPRVTRGSGLSVCVPMSPCRVSHVVQGCVCCVLLTVPTPGCHPSSPCPSQPMPTPHDPISLPFFLGFGKSRGNPKVPALLPCSSSSLSWLLPLHVVAPQWHFVPCVPSLSLPRMSPQMPNLVQPLPCHPLCVPCVSTQSSLHPSRSSPRVPRAVLERWHPLSLAHLVAPTVPCPPGGPAPVTADTTPHPALVELPLLSLKPLLSQALGATSSLAHLGATPAQQSAGDTS
ncbi:putative keratin-associated protein 4-16 [Molothrus ater]|uniref:putative keratin-associated protein 4-16 n=1 Tax=Molothrus ater TaxID=84834 RepID=UPI00174C53F0|nr:putative keratin-associated protein 4-16 [Molothrus ater]